MSKCKRCADHRKLKAERDALKTQLEESSGTIRYVTGQRDEAWHRQDAAVAKAEELTRERDLAEEVRKGVWNLADHRYRAMQQLREQRDALKAEIGAAWEAAPDGYETDSLESLVKALAFVAEGEHEIQQADPPQPYIDGALAWLASIEDELDTMDAMQLWGRFFGWLEAQR